MYLLFCPSHDVFQFRIRIGDDCITVVATSRLSIHLVSLISKPEKVKYLYSQNSWGMKSNLYFLFQVEIIETMLQFSINHVEPDNHLQLFELWLQRSFTHKSISKVKNFITGMILVLNFIFILNLVHKNECDEYSTGIWV